jgi:hypothetical protein
MGTRRALIITAALGLAFVAPVGRAGAEVTRGPFEAMAIYRVTAPTPAPDLVFRALDGREVRVGDLRGQLVLLGFFTTW